MGPLTFVGTLVPRLKKKVGKGTGVALEQAEDPTVKSRKISTAAVAPTPCCHWEAPRRASPTCTA